MGPVPCRCLRTQLPDPQAIAIRLYSAYEVYLDGEKIGSAGDIRSGHFSMDALRVFPLPQSLSRNHQPTIALRITYRRFALWPTGTVPSLEIHLGDENALRARRTNVVLVQAFGRLANPICYCIIGLIGFMLLALSLSGGMRQELKLLALVCLTMMLIYLNYFCGPAVLLNYSDVDFVLIW